jgi:SAM-dependent methyltransferase
MGLEGYVIRGGAEGRERLRLLSEVFGPFTQALLEEVGIPAGSACLDVGCGGGDVTHLLARAAGATGRALGVDLDAVKLELARREAQMLGTSNVEFVMQDVVTWEPKELFDVAYARFLLTHLTDPGALVTAIRRHIRPGGVFIVEDIDFRGHFAEPDCPALRRDVEYYSKSVQARGADPNIGPRLPGLLRDGGFREIGMKLVQSAALEGGIKRLCCVTLESIADAVLKDGLTTEQELRDTLAELDAFANNRTTLIAGPRVVQAWGRVPA